MDLDYSKLKLCYKLGDNIITYKTIKRWSNLVSRPFSLSPNEHLPVFWIIELVSNTPIESISKRNLVFKSSNIFFNERTKKIGNLLSFY